VVEWFIRGCHTETHLLDLGHKLIQEKVLGSGHEFPVEPVGNVLSKV
jgi:hypothetical protein